MENNKQQYETVTRQEWRDNGQGGLKPVMVTYRVKEKFDAPNTLIPINVVDAIQPNKGGDPQ